MSESVANAALALAAVVLYAGSLAVWPIYRITRRGRERARALFVLFLVNVAAMAGWTVLEISWAIPGGDDWLHGLLGYVAINVLFLVAYPIAWWSRRMGVATRSR